MKRWRVRVVAVGVGLLCFFGRASGQSTPPSATLVSLTTPARVVPGGTVPVTARMEIRHIQPDLVRLVFTGDSSWSNANLNYSTTISTVPIGGVDVATALYTGSLAAPRQVGIHSLMWRPSELNGQQIGTGTISARVEVTCSDGIFCNGEERFVNNRCVAGLSPCDDGEACTTDQCSEADGACTHVLGENCAACAAKNCTPHCQGRVCGSDGCGGTCGSCPIGEDCSDGACVVPTILGSCSNPIPLLAPSDPLFGIHMLEGDTSDGLNQVHPVCAVTSAAPEKVYSFTVLTSTGIDARATGFDTVLSLQTDCSSGSLACSDDAAPPGGLGSRVTAMLNPGTYVLIVDGATSSDSGPFELSTNLVSGCVPQCEGRFCGDDGCGGSCGPCLGDEFCSATGRCQQAFCVPSCNGRKCGDDGCGGSCGTCSEGSICDDGACRAVPLCDSIVPVCKTSCGNSKYCGTDCACHVATRPAPDLVVDHQRLLDSLAIDSVTVGAASCSLAEGCANGTGLRRVLRYSAGIINQGQEDLVVPDRLRSPGLFESSPCNGQLTLKLLEATLRDASGTPVVIGRQSLPCLRDSVRSASGPSVECSQKYSCSNQGLQAGWENLTSSSSCPWLDITDVPAGNYVLSVNVNPGRVLDEASFANNIAEVPVTIPAPAP